jgi:hypothetical protein
MKQAIRLFSGLFAVTLLLSVAGIAQDQYTEGTVSRVNLVHVVPGHFDAFLDDMKANLKPIWEAEKSSGILEDYHVFLNQTKSQAEDWDIGVELVYKNMAALDGLGMKVLDLRMKHFGDKSKEQQVVNKRVENAHVVASYLIRSITLK